MNLLKRLWHKLGGVNGLILILYTTFVLASHAFPIYSGYNRTFQLVARSLCNCAILSTLLCPFLLKKVRGINLCTDNECTQKEHRRWLLFSSATVLAYFLLAYIAYYPGGFNTDSLVQYEQAVTGQYVDWHPFFHTLLFFKLPLLLTGGWIGSIVLFQLLMMTAAVLYSIHTILLHAGRTAAVSTLVFYLINPNTVNLFMYPFKDNAFAIGAILLTAYAINIFFTKGEWLKNPLHTALFIICFACTTCFRHNAVLFTAPLLIAVLLFTSRKSHLILFVCCLILVLVIKLPLANALDVQAAEQRKVETMGLPLNVIASVVTYHPDALDGQTQEFAYRIAEQNIWEERYTYGNFNYIKSDDRINIMAIEEYSIADILKMALRCLLRAPQESLAGLVSATDPVYTLTDDYNAVFPIQITQNEWGIRSSGAGILASLFSAFSSISSLLLSYLVHFIGAMMLILLLVILAKSRLNRWEDWKRILLVLPVFTYNFGSMLLMTHRGDALRFFQYTFYLVPLYLLLFFTNYHGRNRIENPEEKQ